MKNNAFLIILIIGFVAFGAWKIGLFSSFTPYTALYPTQYLVDSADQSYINDITKSMFGSGTFITHTTNPNELHNLGATTDLYRDSIFASNITINTGRNVFMFAAEKTSTGTSFGLPSNPSNINLLYCWQRIKVYKDGTYLTQFQSWGSTNNDPLGTKNYFQTNEYKVYDDSGKTYISIKMNDLGLGNNDAVVGRGCRAFFNSYKLILPPDSFTFNATSQANVVVGQNFSVNFIINNHLSQTYKADVQMTLNAPTLFGFAQKTIIQNDVILNPGNNNIALMFVPQSETGLVEITPQLTIKSLGSNFNNLNFNKGNLIYAWCTGTTGSGACDSWDVIGGAGAEQKVNPSDYINVGTVDGDKVLVSVYPKPLYVNLTGSSCPSGYVLSNNGLYCLRNDIQDLGCFLLGCPVISGHEYSCTSSGMCAETIYVDKKCTNTSMCPSGASCDVPTGLCIKTEVYENIVQCSVSSDCLIPCQGKVATCINKTCSYSGACVSQPPTQTTTKTFWDSLKDIWNTFLQWLSSIFS